MQSSMVLEGRKPVQFSWKLSRQVICIDLAAEASPVTSAKEVWTLATVENMDSAAPFEQKPTQFL